jgi:alanine dehydrogenase
MKTLILTQKDIKKVLTPTLAIKTVNKAFKAYGSEQVQMPPKSYLYFKHGDLRTMPAYICGQGFNIAGTKSVNVHTENYRKNLPTVMAVIILTDPETGFPLAVMDGTFITAMRTGAAAALATKLLCRKKAKTAGFLGSGAQAYMQLACLMEVTKIRGIRVWQYTPEDDSAFRFCRWAEKTYSLQAAISANIDDITTQVDILITTTPSRKPLVTQVSPGVHINAIGADAQGKQEIHPGVLKKSKVVIDDWAQAVHSGEINVPFSKKELSEKDIHATLGELATGQKAGRTSDEEITVFDSTGLAIQDVSCAFIAYQSLKDQRGIKKVAFF